MSPSVQHYVHSEEYKDFFRWKKTRYKALHLLLHHLLLHYVSSLLEGFKSESQI